MTAVLTLMLAGCSLGPDYAQPPLEIPEVPARHLHDRRPGLAVGGMVARLWLGRIGHADRRSARKQFHILAAIARVRQADAALRIAGAPLLPSVNATAQANWQRNSVTAVRINAGGGVGAVNSHYVETRSYTLSPSVSYELDFWGALRAGRDAATATALFSRFDQQTVALTTVTSVADTWFQALAQQDRIDVARLQPQRRRGNPARHPGAAGGWHRQRTGCFAAGGIGRRQGLHSRIAEPA